MPMSNPGHMPVVIHYLIGLAPRSLLDVGVGLGTYGFMARQFLDIAQQGLDRNDWLMRIDGIEIFEPYRNSNWSSYYDSVTIADIREQLKSLDNYEVILCNDVLEHFEQHEARMLVQELLKKCRVLIATTPSCTYPQGAWGGNEAETHLSSLSRADFPADTQTHSAGVTNIYVCWSDPALKSTIADLAKSSPRVTYPRSSVLRRLLTAPSRLYKQPGLIFRWLAPR